MLLPFGVGATTWTTLPLEIITIVVVVVVSS